MYSQLFNALGFYGARKPKRELNFLELTLVEPHQSTRNSKESGLAKEGHKNSLTSSGTNAAGILFVCLKEEMPHGFSHFKDRVNTRTFLLRTCLSPPSSCLFSLPFNKYDPFLCVILSFNWLMSSEVFRWESDTGITQAH